MITIDKTQKKAINRLLASLIGDRDKTIEMGPWVLSVDMLPDDMIFEQIALSQFYVFKNDGIAPTEDNLRLAFVGKDYDDRLNELFEIRASHPADTVPSLAYSLRNYIDTQRLKLAGQRVAEITSDKTKTAADAGKEAVKVLQRALPKQKTITERTGLELADTFFAEQARNIENAKQGKTIGPCLPWAQEVLPYLIPGDILTIAAKTKFGKTTMAALIAEYIAYKIGGYDVLFVHLETNQIAIASRIMSRKLLIPRNTLFQGFYRHPKTRERVYVDMREEPWRSKRDEILRSIAKAEEQKGCIIYQHDPGITIEQLELSITMQQAISEARGRKLVVVLDYFQEVDWSAYNADKQHGLNAAASKLKNVIEQRGCYAIVFAQDDPETHWADETLRVRYCRQLPIVSQIGIRLERDRAETDLPMMERKGKQKKDSLGFNMFWQRKGSLQSESRLNFVQGNNIDSGISVRVYFNQRFFDIVDGSIYERYG